MSDDALVCDRFWCFSLHTFLVYSIRIDIACFVWLTLSFYRCLYSCIEQDWLSHIESVFLLFCCVFFVFLGFFLCFNALHWVLIRWVIVCTACGRLSCSVLCLCVCILSGAFYMAPLFFSSISSLFLFQFVFFNVLEVATVRESRVLLFTSLFVLRALFHGFAPILPSWLWLCWVCPCMCVVAFSCSACFFLL